MLYCSIDLVMYMSLSFNQLKMLLIVSTSDNQACVPNGTLFAYIVHYFLLGPIVVHFGKQALLYLFHYDITSDILMGQNVAGEIL